jgi:hypothetical protein
MSFTTKGSNAHADSASASKRIAARKAFFT